MMITNKNSSDVEAIKTLADGSKRIVFVSGNFNTVHPGHLRLLRFARECGDFLVVGIVEHDPNASMLLDEELRLDGVKCINFVNYAFILRTTPENFIQQLKPAIVVKGKEYEAIFNSEEKSLKEYGGKLLFSSGEMRFSSIDLLKREIQELNISRLVRPIGFLQKHAFSLHDLRTTVSKFKGFRVTVIGDLIVDEYIACEPIGMSQEDPTLVVSPLQHEKFIGGAAIVAAHARQLGADVQYLSIAGRDTSGEFARDKLSGYGVKAEILEDESRPTTLKQRYRAGGKTLLRVSHLREHEIGHSLESLYMGLIKKALQRTDLVIFSDFNYGCLTQSLVEHTIELCRRKKILMVADSQSSSQVGDVSRFKGMMLLTPTEREARLAVRDFKCGLVVLAEKLRKKSRAENIALTLGAEGLLVHATANNKEGWLTDRLPALNQTPIDSAGAGDSLLTCCSMAMAVGADIWQSIFLGSIAAACQVSRVGNIPLSSGELIAELVD